MFNKRLLLLLFLFLGLISMLPISYSLTAAIGNARAFIKVNASPEEPAVLERTILVQNRNEIDVKAIVRVGEEWERFVNILDKEFVLEPDESKKARYILTIDRGGSFEIKINVAFEPADPSIKENKVGVSSTLIISSNGPIIEEPEEEQEEEQPEEEQEDSQEQPGDPFAQTEITGFEEEEGENTEPEVIEIKNKSVIKPLVGILITILIIGIGLGVFFIIQRLR